MKNGALLQIMKWKLLPYILLLVFTAITAVIRLFILSDLSWQMHLAAFFIQAAIFTLTWFIILIIGKFLDNVIPFEKNVIKRIIIQMLLALIVIAPFYIFIISNIDDLHLKFITKPLLAVVSVLFFLFVILLNFGYNAYYFFEQWQQSVEEKAQLQIKAAELAKDKSMMQYHHLKNQVNPHFLFNTFSSLDGLIQTNPELASEFVRQLSKVYRYVLEHKENEVVSLQTETDFIQHYVSLLQMRYGNVLRITMDISKDAMEKGIVMVTMQMLIDNAIKHNSMQTANPLVIKISDDAGYLSISNNKQLKKQIETSNKQGVQQLKDLYSYLSELPITINETEKIFEIKLPLL